MKYFWLFSLVFILFNFVTTESEFSTIQDLLKHLWNKLFSMKFFSMVKNHFEKFRNHIRQRFSIAVFFKQLWILRQLVSYVFFVTSTLWEEFCLTVILRSNFLQYLMLVLINSSLYICVCEYINVEFSFLFGETSANSLEM